jgi:TIR domain
MLTSSQRVTLLKEISERLSKEDWSLIDVTLAQFKLKTTNSWNGTNVAYILEMAKGAPDATLVELAHHVGFSFEQVPSVGVDPPFWRKRMYRLFISHLSGQRMFAAELQESLLRYGISAFVAHNDIEPTLEWQAQIETALSTAESLIALLHPDFHASNWTDQEIGFAMGRGLPVYAVHFGHAPYGFIGRFQAFAGQGKTAAALAREIFDSYRKNKQSQRKMADVLVGLFEDSPSFADAKARIGYLEELEFWDVSFVARIQTAAESNSQIGGSWGVPERVASLSKKWI